jgi:hypothetical protein
MARINLFQNIEDIHDIAAGQPGIGTLFLQGVYIQGSLSFNNVAMLRTHSGTTAKTISLYFGLYSLNASTLSLANSASHSSNPAAAGANTSWVTLATSATQDITPGNWYFAFLISTAGTSRVGVMFADNVGGANVTQSYGGPFVRGYYGTTTNALPASIATSDCVKENTSTTVERYPYVVISA